MGLFVSPEVAANRTPPSDFVKRLQNIFGKSMHVEWNPRKNKWVIEECIGHNGEVMATHGHLCRRVYVWLVRDEDTDEYMPLNERVIDKLHSMETARRYGTGEAALQRFLIESRNFDENKKQKDEALARETMIHSRKSNRTTFNKFMDLFRRHDLRPNR